VLLSLASIVEEVESLLSFCIDSKNVVVLESLAKVSRPQP